MSSIGNLSDQLQLWGFEEGFTLFSDGSLGFSLEIEPIDISCLQDVEIDQFCEHVKIFINALPENTQVQFIGEIVYGNSDVISKFAELSQPGLSETLSQLVGERVAALRNQDELGLIPKQRLYALVRKSPSYSSSKTNNPFAKKALFQKTIDSILNREIKNIQSLKSEVVHGFEVLGITAKELPEEKVSELVYSQWNPDRSIDLGVMDPNDVRSSLLFTDVVLSENGFSLGEYHHRVLSLKNLPDQTFSGAAKIFQELPIDSRVFVTLSLSDQAKEVEKLQTQRRMAFSMSRGKKNGVSDLESDAKFEDLEELLCEIVSGNEKVIKVSINVLLRNRNLEVLEDQVARVLSLFRDLSNSEGMLETIASFDVFSELSIPNATANERSKRLKSSNAIDFLPLYGNWKGHITPRVILRSEAGALVGFDPFSPQLSNYNQIVTGGSGSGKSFLTNLLLLQMLKENPKVYIVDIGGSYKKLCDNLNGQYIPFDLSSSLSLNPFDLSAGEKVPSPQKVKFLVGLIEMMTKEEGETGLGRLERAEIEEQIINLYSGVLPPTLSVLRAALLNHSDALIRKYGKILGPWCGNTPYGHFVDRTTTVSLEKQLVSFDLKGLENYPDLQAVCLYLITDFVWREVQRNRSEMKFLVFDECWKLLENPAGSAFIAEVFRTFRKYFASAIAISQNIDDFAKSRASQAILPNTSTKWVLMQKGANKERLREVLSLNDREVEIISNLHQEKGVYSQAFLMTEEKHALVHLEPTPLEYWIATTDPRDLSKFDEVMKKSPLQSLQETLEYLSKEYPQGASAIKRNEK